MCNAENALSLQNTNLHNPQIRSNKIGIELLSNEEKKPKSHVLKNDGQ